MVVKLKKVAKERRSGLERIRDKINVHKRYDFSQDFGLMKMVEKEVKCMFQFLKLHNLRIRLFVDDLDRCDQKKCMEVVWAISLLFGRTNGPITSFLTVDTKIVVDHIFTEFKGKVNGYRYLEKIINLLFSIPQTDIEQKKDFFEQTFDSLVPQVKSVYDNAVQCRKSANIGKFVDDLPEDVERDENMFNSLIGIVKKSTKAEVNPSYS